MRNVSSARAQVLPLARTMTPMHFGAASRCVKNELDEKRTEAFLGFMSGREASPQWPKCPTCNFAFQVEFQEALEASCGVKNYLLCEIMDILCAEKHL